jgi:hypothetical protein
MQYWDATALLRLYVPGPGTAALRELIAAAREPLLTSVFSGAELLAALGREPREAGWAQSMYSRYQFDCQAGRIEPQPWDAEAQGEAERLAGLAAGALIHLSTAAAAKARVVVSLDAQLRAAAVRAGARVLPSRLSENRL